MSARALIAHGGPQRLPTRAAPSLVRALRDARGSPPWTPWTILCRLDRHGTRQGSPLSMWRGNLDRKPYSVISECSRDVERCLTKRAPVALLVLRPCRSSFSVSLIKPY